MPRRRVKTLHPKIHGGFLFLRGNRQHEEQAKRMGIDPIDLVVVNLYPFEEVISRPEADVDAAIENIDIGGPAMLRAAAKNHVSITVVVDPNDYDEIIESIRENGGDTTLELRRKLACKVYQRTAAYDAAIARYLGSHYRIDPGFVTSLPLCSELRYGDNPHQEATLYGNFADYFTQLHGRDLSYTNVLDIEAATELVLEFARPTVAILKHTNPCGVGSDEEDLRAAWEKAYETDKQAPFGGVIVSNRPLTESLARVVSEIFTDIIIAPGFEAKARAIFQKKKNLRLIQFEGNYAQLLEAAPPPVVRSAPGGLIVMERDSRALGLDRSRKRW